MATLPHALAALVLCNFRFASFLERAHSDFQIREPRFNHLIRRIATEFFASSTSSGLGRSRWRRQHNIARRIFESRETSLCVKPQFNALHHG